MKVAPANRQKIDLHHFCIKRLTYTYTVYSHISLFSTNASFHQVLGFVPVVSNFVRYFCTHHMSAYLVYLKGSNNSNPPLYKEKYVSKIESVDRREYTSIDQLQISPRFLFIRCLLTKPSLDWIALLLDRKYHTRMYK